MICLEGFAEEEVNQDIPPNVFLSSPHYDYYIPPKEPDIPEEYLIITPECFVHTLHPLVLWRQAEGLLVTVKTIPEIKREIACNESLTSEKLRNFLIVYYNQQPALTYVLLVGDVEYIPVKYADDDGSDLYYSLLDDTADVFPDVYLGRIPCNTPIELEHVIAKTIMYEKMSPSKKIIFASYFQDSNLDGVADRDYIAISEKYKTFLMAKKYECSRIYVKTPGSFPTYYSDHTPIPSDITFDGTTQDIISLINSGTSLIYHRDHGTILGWEHPCFTCDDIAFLKNKRFPLLFCVDCETGHFDAETTQDRYESEGTPIQVDSESFAEKILLQEFGAVALIAPSRITHNSVNDVFSHGLMGAIWPKMLDSMDSPAHRLGQILYRGRIMVYREFSENGWIGSNVLCNFRQYHILGDPALRIRQPQ